MLEIGVILFIFIFSYILILRNFKLSLYVLIVLSVFMHKELFSFYQWDLMPARIFMLALFCAGLTQIYLYLIKTKSLKPLFSYLKDPFILTLVLLWLVRGISIVNTKNLQASILLYAFFTTVVALGIYIYLTFKDTPQELLKYVRFYIYTTFVLTLFGLLQLALYYKTGKVIGAMWPVPGKVPRVGSLFWDVNHYGALLAAVLPVLGMFIVTDKGIKKKLLNILMFGSISASLLLTNSRSAWMLGGFALLTFVTLLFLKKFGFKGIVYVIIAIVLVSTPMLIEYSDKKSPFRQKIKDAFHYRIDSFDSHFMLLTGAYQIFEDYPVLGGGYGSFFEHFSKTEIAPTLFSRDPAALNTRVPAHTIWGEALSETGMVGTSVFVVLALLLLLAPLYVFFSSGDKSVSLLGSAMASVFVGWYIAGIFYSYNSEFFWIVSFIYLIWSVGHIGKDYLKKIISFFFGKSRFLLATISLLAFFLIFFRLGVNHLIPWDEAIYAKVAKNMVENNQYLVLHWDSLIKGWFEKPPLYMWMASGFMNVLGFTSLAARLPSAIFGFLTVILVFVFANKLFNKTVAFISSLSILTTVHFLYYSRASMLDVTTTFFITLALYCYWCAKTKDKRVTWILSGLSVGLAAMTKGFVGLLPLLIIGLYEICLFVFQKQKINKRLVLNYLLLFGSSVLVAVPWHITMYKMFGREFVNKYFVYHVWDRATMAIEDKGNPFFWYIIVLKVSMRTWFVALLGAFPLGLYLALKKDKRFTFLSIWALSIFFFFSLAKSKLTWYIIPIYPSLCILVGYFIERVLNFVMGKVRLFNSKIFKFLAMYLLVVFSLFYLFLNRGLVYTDDLNGSKANLLEMESDYFGANYTVYMSRMEEPTPLFYLKSPYKIVDFRADKSERVPVVSDNEPLILVTKKGRYSVYVAGYSVPSKIVAEDGDWVLWYMPPKVGVFELPKVSKSN
ncbi:MAG: glycosyltransferase family 39 protein [Patescibacteria group bacterium]